jgi:hypothetical protein
MLMKNKKTRALTARMVVSDAGIGVMLLWPDVTLSGAPSIVHQLK